MKEILFIEAKSKEEYQIAGSLFQEYADQLGVDLEFQNFKQELATLETQFSRPHGVLFLVKNASDEFIGCFAVRDYEHPICELKRMYIKAEARGLGIGRKMLEKSIEISRQLGYEKMRLDTLPSMTKAQSLYSKMGFYDIDPYRYNPIKWTKFMEIIL